jgi:cardiolipin synthase
MMIVDGKDMIAGGMNVGDVYSHGGGPDAGKWRDTDMHLQGRAVADGVGLFASMWNEQVRTHGLGHDLFNQRDAVADAKRKARDVSGGAKAAVVDHVPGPEGDAHILLGTLKAIEGATESVDIENAYFITTPAIEQALFDALERGVKVRLLTNSDKSVDEPIVSAPIMASLPALIEKGAEVYVKEGDTLHSKFMVVDGHFSQVGSYNLHPRSHRYEGELMMHVLDDGFAGEMTDAFQNDLDAAIRLERASDVNVPSNALSVLADRYFFDQL